MLKSERHIEHNGPSDTPDEAPDHEMLGLPESIMVYIGLYCDQEVAVANLAMNRDYFIDIIDVLTIRAQNNESLNLAVDYITKATKAYQKYAESLIANMVDS